MRTIYVWRGHDSRRSRLQTAIRAVLWLGVAVKNARFRRYLCTSFSCDARDRCDAEGLHGKTKCLQTSAGERRKGRARPTNARRQRTSPCSEMSLHPFLQFVNVSILASPSPFTPLKPKSLKTFPTGFARGGDVVKIAEGRTAIS